MPSNHPQLIRHFKWSFMVAIGISLFLSTALWAVRSYYSYLEQSEQMRTDFIAEQKELIRFEVERLIQYISHQKLRIGELSRKHAMDETDRMVAAIENFRTAPSDQSQEEKLKLLLSSFNTNPKDPTFFLLSPDGSLLFPPKTDAAPSSAPQENLSQSLAQLPQTGDASFIPNPLPNAPKDSLACVKPIPSTGFILGSSVSPDTANKEIQREILNWAAKVRFGQNGYFFVYDWTGKVISHGAQPELVGQNLINFEDSRGTKVIQRLIEVAKTPTGDFVEYWWRKPDTKKERPKVSYAQGVPEWEWMLGTGVYTDDIEQTIAANFQKLQKSIFVNIATNLGIFIVILGCVYLYFGIVTTRKFKHSMDSFLNFFHRAATEFHPIRTDDLSFQEFQTLAQAANRMIQERDAILQKILKTQEELKAKEQEALALMAHAEKAREEAETANRLKTQFLTNISHEIRTPMNAIMGFAQIIRFNETNPDNIASLDIIEKSGNNLINIINDILDISKMEAGKLAIEKKPSDPQKIVEEVVGFFEFSFREKGLYLRTETLGDLPPLMLLDPVRTKQILFNLLGNAVKFTQSGGVSITVKAIPPTVEEPSYTLSFAVQDTGSGIPENQFATIFEPFCHQENQDLATFGGVGLGLPICRRLANLMGGEIFLDSKIGQGSSFTLQFPSAKFEETTEISASSLIAQPGSTFVLVEPDPDETKNILSCIDLKSITVLDASSIWDALELARHNRIQLFLISLPEPDSIPANALRLLKSTKETAKIPAVFFVQKELLAAYQPLLEELQLSRHIVCKPFAKNDLQKIIASALTSTQS